MTVNQKCKNVITKKHNFEGHADNDHVAKECALVLAEEYQSYRADLKKKVTSLTKNDKRWWQLNKELLNHKVRVSSIPPLRDADGKWITDKTSMLLNLIK